MSSARESKKSTHTKFSIFIDKIRQNKTHEFSFAQSAPYHVARSPIDHSTFRFEEFKPTSDSNAGFQALGITRHQAVKILSAMADDEEVRKALASEIYDELMNNRIIPKAITPQLQALKQEYQQQVKQNFDEAKLCKAKIKNYCRTKEMYLSYVTRHLGEQGWLGYGSALLIAKEKKYNIFIWTQERDSPYQLYCINHYFNENNVDTIHMLSSNGYTRFSLLAEPKLSTKKSKTRAVNEEEKEEKTPANLPADYFEQVKNAYLEHHYGIKVTFNEAPIIGRSEKEFIFSGPCLLIMLTQSWPQLYELTQEPLYFDGPHNYPVKSRQPHEWLDAAQLLLEGKSHEQLTPKLQMDVGGRKIITQIPSDKYCYDRGKLPLYAVRLVPSLENIREKQAIILYENDEALETITNADHLGENPVLNQKGSDRLSYIDFYLALKNHYGAAFDDSAIAQECRRVLAGRRLNPQHAAVLPVMLATMFCAEVSRNRACLVTGMMLLDLIENQVKAPLADEKGENYCFANALWHPKLYGLASKERCQETEKRTLGRLGGFHPMAHVGSWEEEFKNDGPYQQQANLTFSHIKSVMIMIDWLEQLPGSLTKGFKVSRLSKEEYLKYEEESASADNSKQLILTNYLYPLVSLRMSSFSNMQSPLVDPLSSHPEDIRMDRLNQKADEAVKQREEEYYRLKDERRKTAFHDGDNYFLSLEDKLVDDESCLNTIKQIDPDFDSQRFNYCKENTESKYVVKLFIKLYSLKEPLVENLSIILLNPKDKMDNTIIYKLIFSSAALFDKLARGYVSPSGFISSLSTTFPLQKELVAVLLAKETENLLGRLSGEEIYKLCEQSIVLFARIMIDKPSLFKRIINSVLPYQLHNKIYQLNDGDLQLTPEEWQRISRHNYNEGIQWHVKSVMPSSFSTTESKASPKPLTLFFNPASGSESKQKTESPDPQAEAALNDLFQKDFYIQFNKDLPRMLRNAANKGFINDMHIILKFKESFDLNAQGPDSLMTALHYCIKRKDLNCAKALLDAGARVDLADKSNKTVQQYVEESSDPSIRALSSYWPSRSNYHP